MTAAIPDHRRRRNRRRWYERRRRPVSARARATGTASATSQPSTGCGPWRSWPCLLYHARFQWIPGGFLGVSTFFTLSGFLITSLMLREWHELGGISLRRFFSRRFRRLLPASWFTLAGGGDDGCGRGCGRPTSSETCAGMSRGRSPSSSTGTSSLQGRTYGAQFEAPSPLEHFWSLAIEQQFYLMLPVVVVLGVLGWSTAPRCRRPEGGGTRRGAGSHLTRASGRGRAGNGRGDLAGAQRRARPELDRHGRTSAPTPGSPSSRRALCWPASGCGCLRGGARPPRGASSRRWAWSGWPCRSVLWSTATVGSTWLYPWGLLVTPLASVVADRGALQAGLLARVLELAPRSWRWAHQLRGVPAALAGVPLADPGASGLEPMAAVRAPHGGDPHCCGRDVPSCSRHPFEPGPPCSPGGGAARRPGGVLIILSPACWSPPTCRASSELASAAAARRLHHAATGAGASARGR